MASWEETLGELKAQFVESALQRVERMSGLLEALRADPNDGVACRELMIQFHGLAGAGTTYGFPEVTRLGLLGESLTGGREAPSVGDGSALPAIEAAIAELRAALQSPGGGDQQPAAADDPAAPAAGPERARVLVVEGDPDWGQRLRRRLEREGYLVESAVSGAEARAAIERSLPDAVLCDAALPDGPGHALVAELRRGAAGDELPILITGPAGDFLDKVEALTSGADGSFHEPLDWEALLFRLEHLVGRRRLEPARVLCVEDFAEQAEFLRRVLASAGYEVETLADPARFEAVVTAFRPDLVLMDILLPGPSGYELTRYLRQHERFAALPVVFLTTEAGTAARIRALEAGGDDFLAKPVEPGLLLTAVAAHLERARLLKSLVERDGLTRLLTHSSFVERAKAAHERARRRPGPRPALVMFDLDSFKAVNDRFGHPEGDRVLGAFASLLRRRLRQSDVIGRYGGEEFAVVLEALDEPDAVRLADRLRAEFAELEHRSAEGSAFHVTVSAGVAGLPARPSSFEAWRKAADAALYRAKQQGRDRVVGTADAAGR